MEKYIAVRIVVKDEDHCGSCPKKRIGALQAYCTQFDNASIEQDKRLAICSQSEIIYTEE